MRIELKPIKIKTNEWKPQQEFQEYFCFDDLNKIIDEEKLKENMFCRYNVDCDFTNQVLTNIVFNCTDYNGEFIYLVKSTEIVPNREYFWVYVSAKNIDKTQIKLELTIDTISSNLDLFNDNKFAGEVYIERTNNRLRCVNDIHSDVCNKIENKINKLEETTMKIRKEIDTFLSYGIHQYYKLIEVDGLQYPDNMKLDEKGTVIMNNSCSEPSSKVVGFTSTRIMKRDNLIGSPNLIKTINEILPKYTIYNVTYDDSLWPFSSSIKYDNFVDEVINQTSESFYILMRNIDNIITQRSSNQINNWLTIPVIFDITETNQLSNFNINLKTDLENYDIKNHLHLHYEIFLTIDKDLFKIPINLLELINNNYTIYGTRLFIEKVGIIFKFYYEKEKINEFYTIDITLLNDINSTEYNQWKNELNIAYNTGQKGLPKFLSSFIQNIATSIPSFIAGRGFGLFSTSVNVINMGFNLYRDTLQEKYNEQLIMNKRNQNDTLLLGETLNKLLFNEKYCSLLWGWLSANPRGTIKSGYYVVNKNEIKNEKNIEFFSILIKQPIQCDIDKIELDQKQYGNILSEFLVNNEEYQNPLIINNVIPTDSDHLYWKGKVNPNSNPIDNFQLDFLNQTLARGIKILKCKK